MQFGQNGIPTDKVDNNYGPLPEGWYQAQIISEKEQPTAKGGTLLTYEFNILGKYEGNQCSTTYANRKVWGSYNVVCPSSEKAEEIAMTEIARMGKACNIVNVRNSSDLVTKTMDIRLGIRQDAGYEPKNEIKGYRSCSSAPAPGMGMAPAAPQPTAGNAAPAGGVTPPWGGR